MIDIVVANTTPLHCAKEPFRGRLGEDMACYVGPGILGPHVKVYNNDDRESLARGYLKP
jgi:hypothetical protein